MVYADIWMCGACTVVNDLGYCTSCRRPKGEVYKLEICHICKINVAGGHLYCAECGEIYCGPCRDYDRKVHEKVKLKENP